MKTEKNKRVVYVISSICAVLILGIGILVGTSNFHNYLEIGKTDGLNGNSNIELNINRLNNKDMLSFDADVKIIEMEEIPEEYKFMENISIPEEYVFENSYQVYTRESKDTDQYSVLHDFVFHYRKDELNDIKIAFSKIETPIRDYYIENGKKVSKIQGVELNISQWKETYIITFKDKDLYFDLETTGITEEQLVDFLESIINRKKN